MHKLLVSTLLILLNICTVSFGAFMKELPASDVRTEPGLLLPNIAVIDSSDSIVFDMSNAIINGTQVQVPIYINSDDNIYAVDFSFRFNNQKLDYDTITLASAGSVLLAVSYLNPNDSIVRFTSSALVTVSNQVVLAYIHFNILPGQSLSALDMFNLKGYLNGDACSESVIPPAPVGLNNEVLNWNMSFYPNPAVDALYIQMDKDASIELMDIQGKTVLLSQELFAGRRNDIDLGSFHRGLYLARVFNADGECVKKLMVIK